MKNPYIDLNRIEFVVTDRCTGQCMHCSAGGSACAPGTEAHVRPDAACEAIRSLCKRFEITSVMTFGGEPLLYPEVVCAIHSTARECGVQRRDLITNGFFSRDRERIGKVAAMIGNAGITRVMLSVDAFHQQTIPSEPVKCFADALKEQGQPGFSLHPAWLVNSDAANKYNARTREVLAGFGDIPVSSGNNIFMAGNAVKYLAEYYPPAKLDPNDCCGAAPYTDPPTDVRCVSIVPCGDVMVCGFVIGNIYNEPIDDIIDRYDPYEYPLMCAAAHGVTGLMEFAGKQGINPELSVCYSICDLCRQIGEQMNK